MGIWNAVELFASARDIAVEQSRQPIRSVRMSPLSPWATRGTLSKIDYNPDVFAQTAQPVTVDEAMSVGPIKKGRAILHALIASRPLVAIRNVDGIDTQLSGKDAPTWLYRSDTDISPQQRMADMLDDHLFHDATVLAVERGVSEGKPILDAVHLPYDWWQLDEHGVLLVNDQPVSSDAVIYIPGPSRGLLVEAQAEIREWRQIRRNVAQRLGTPAPTVLLHDPDPQQLTDSEVDDLVQKAGAARRSPNGAVMYTGHLDATVVPNSDDSALFIEARNALRLDLANHINLPAAVLDGSAATASLTYSTSEGKRSEVADYSLDYWTTPLTRRLSQDDVVPRSTRIRFDFGDLFAVSNAPTGARTQD